MVERQHKKAALAHEQEELYVLRAPPPLGRAALADAMDACLAPGSGDALLRDMLKQVRGQEAGARLASGGVVRQEVTVFLQTATRINDGVVHALQLQPRGMAGGWRARRTRSL